MPFLNSLMPRPRLRPMAGRRLAPNRTAMTMITHINSEGPSIGPAPPGAMADLCRFESIGVRPASSRERARSPGRLGLAGACGVVVGGSGCGGGGWRLEGPGPDTVGLWEPLIVVVVLAAVVGPSRLPKMTRSVGEGSGSSA